jgi:asparagine synthase (glutamine-hydrolysing)
MSAICGILSFNGVTVRDADLDRQINTMTRRGPDRRKIWCAGPVGLGHALMRVTHEDAFDDQPLVDRAAGLTLVADLRLDNREELAGALGIDAAGLGQLPDSALVMAAYKKWGDDCVARLLGDFAFAIWDARAGKFVLARDHMGERYIHYYRGPDFFVFATEKKGLWAVADVPQQLDEFQIGKAVTLDWRNSGGATRFADIFGLIAGTVMTVASDGTTQSSRYWEPHADPVHLDRDESYYIETYRRILAEAVECRLRRNTRPAAVFLSGGFDSAAIAGLAGPVTTAQNRKLIAVSSVMPKGREAIGNPRKWVETCKRHMPHLDVRYVTREGFGLLDNLEEGFLRTDGPSSPNRAANAALYTATVESGVCVVMDGFGGDYTINPRASRWLGEQLLRGRVLTVLAELRACWRNRDAPFSAVLKGQVLRGMLPQLWLKWSHFRLGMPLFGPETPLNPAFARFIRTRGGKLRTSFSKAKTGRYSPVLEIVLAKEQEEPQSHLHVAASAYGLEYTQPFHDKRVVEFALAIPESLYFRNGRPRFLARKALAEVYPPELLTRRGGNDLRTPDFLAIAERSRPQMLSEVARLESDERLSRLFDFAKMRDMLLPVTGRFAASSEQRMRHAIRCLIMARFIEWIERRNRIAPQREKADA